MTTLSASFKIAWWTARGFVFLKFAYPFHKKQVQSVPVPPTTSIMTFDCWYYILRHGVSPLGVCCIVLLLMVELNHCGSDVMGLPRKGGSAPLAVSSPYNWIESFAGAASRPPKHTILIGSSDQLPWRGDDWSASRRNIEHKKLLNGAPRRHQVAASLLQKKQSNVFWLLLSNKEQNYLLFEHLIFRFHGNDTKNNIVKCINNVSSEIPFINSYQKYVSS